MTPQRDIARAIRSPCGGLSGDSVRICGGVITRQIPQRKQFTPLLEFRRCRLRMRSGNRWRRRRALRTGFRTQPMKSSSRLRRRLSIRNGPRLEQTESAMVACKCCPPESRHGQPVFREVRSLCRQDSGMSGAASRGASVSQAADYNWLWTCRLLPAPAIAQAGRSTQARSPLVPRAVTSGRRSMHTGAKHRGLHPQEEGVAE